MGFVEKLTRAYLETDASLLEINPLLVTKEEDVLALDCKLNFDDNAMFRHADARGASECDQCSWKLDSSTAMTS